MTSAIEEKKETSRRRQAAPLPPPLTKKIKFINTFFLNKLAAMPDRYRVRILFPEYFRVVDSETSASESCQLPEGMQYSAHKAALIWRMALLLAVELGARPECEQEELVTCLVQLVFQVNRILRITTVSDFELVAKMVLPYQEGGFCKIPIPPLSTQPESESADLLRKSGRFWTISLAKGMSGKMLSSGTQEFNQLLMLCETLSPGGKHLFNSAREACFTELVERHSSDTSQDAVLLSWSCNNDAVIDQEYYSGGCLLAPESNISTFLSKYPRKLIRFNACDASVIREALNALFRRTLRDIYIGHDDKKVPVYQALAELRRDYLFLLCPMEQKNDETLDIVTVLLAMFIDVEPPLFEDQPFRGFRAGYYSYMKVMSSRLESGGMLYKKLSASPMTEIAERGKNADGQMVTISARKRAPQLESILVEKERIVMSELDQAIDFYFPTLRAQKL